MDSGWHRQWVCSKRDLQRIEENDLKRMVRDNCAWEVKDTRRDFGVALAEAWTGEPHTRRVYSVEYVIFLESGYWWRVPHVRLRCIYDQWGQGKLDMSRRDFEALYDTYFPGTKHDRRVTVRGLEANLHNSTDPDEGLELRPEVAERLRQSADLPAEALIPAAEVRRRLGL